MHFFVKPVLFFAAFACLVTLSGCDDEQASLTAAVEPETKDQRQSGLYLAPLNLDELIAEVAAATYLVQCPKASGSAWGFSHNSFGRLNRALITNQHVVASCLSSGVRPLITDSNWDEFSGTVIASKFSDADPESESPLQDFAVIYPEIEDFATLENYSAHHAIGAWVMTSSYPALDPDYFTHAITFGNIATKTLLRGVIITAGLNPGSSGGVVINTYGQVLGTIQGGFANTDVNDAGFYLEIEKLWPLLREIELGKP